MSKSRNFVFTWNNYTEDSIAHLASLECKYMIYGKEVAPTTGTPHLQGFIVFANPRSRTGAIAAIGKGVYVAIARGDELQNEVYCSKDKAYFEKGVRPKTQKEKGVTEKQRWADALTAAKEGRVDDIPADIRFRYYNTCKAIARDNMVAPPALDELANLWIYGPSGCGKSSISRKMHPTAYIKNPKSKWWDGYLGQDAVIIDDIDPYMKALGYELKIYGDHYAFPAETKGSALMIRPKVVIITSQYWPEQIWDDKETIDAIKRRYKMCTIVDNEIQYI